MLDEKTEKKEYKKYSYKIVKSGDVLEIYRYEEEQYKAIPPSELDKKINELEDKQEQEKDVSNVPKAEQVQYHRTHANIYRAKRQIKRLINANIHQYKERDKFITLTFRDKPTRDEVLHRFKKFIQRLKYKYPDMKYLGVIERGERGQRKLHLHVLFFGLTYIPVKQFQDIWSYGYVKVNAVNQYFDLANYIIKYITKLLQDSTTIAKKEKFYLCSKGLLKPDEKFYNEEQFQIYIDAMENDDNFNCVFEHTFESEYVGNFDYIKYVKPFEFNEEDALYETQDDEF